MCRFDRYASVLGYRGADGFYPWRFTIGRGVAYNRHAVRDFDRCIPYRTLPERGGGGGNHPRSCALGGDGVWRCQSVRKEFPAAGGSTDRDCSSRAPGMVGSSILSALSPWGGCDFAAFRTAAGAGGGALNQFI